LGLKKCAIEQQLLLGTRSHDEGCSISLCEWDKKFLADAEPMSTELEQMVERIQVEGMVGLSRLVRGQFLFFSLEVLR